MLLMGSCVRRVSSPAYEGTVIDSTTKQPLDEVAVISTGGQATTDNQGKFFLKAVTYRQFTFPGMEAPPLLFDAILNKEGYNEQHIQHFDSRGGGASPSIVWQEEILMTPLTSKPCEKNSTTHPSKTCSPTGKESLKR